jgi:hypothetical protein
MAKRARRRRHRKITQGAETRIVEYRPDALARLYARGVLDLQQHEAGQRLRLLFETARISPLRAQAYDRVYLDTDVVRSHAADLAPKTGEALKALARLRRRMGTPDWPIVTAIVCEDVYVKDLPAALPGLLHRYAAHSIGARVQEAFDRLARCV